MFHFHIAVGVLLLALAAGAFLCCRANCQGECTEKCKKVSKIISAFIMIVAVLSLVCAVYCGIVKGCGGKYRKCHWEKYHSLQEQPLEKGALEGEVKE